MSPQIEIVVYDPEWPQLFQREAKRIRSALHHRALRIEHVGSTSVPDLVAKPTVDILLVVANSADEGAYLTALEEVGYQIRIREPDWHEHRMFKGPDTDINLHVFSSECTEIEKILTFRERLRGNSTDRNLYASTKRELAQKNWRKVQDYADAKAAVIETILSRARKSEK